MILKERNYRLLVVSSSDSFNDAINAYLKDYSYLDVSYVLSANGARKVFLENVYDLVLINTPLTDEFGVHLAIDVTENNSCVALLLTKNDLFVGVYDKVFKSGVYVMAKPFNKSLLNLAFEWMFATRERLRATENKQYSLEEKMAEIRTVNKAKWILIEQFSMSEADAHRYIEKQSMDLCKPRVEVAESIIKTYQN